MNTIGARVAYARSARQWSQAELARQIGVSPQTIQQIENNRTRHSRYLPHIARVTRMELDWLLTGVGPLRNRETARGESSLLPDVQQMLERFANAVAAAVASGDLDADAVDLLERLLLMLTRKR